jgi:hypothetical protein
MSTSCRDFRSLLELSLEGGLVPLERAPGDSREVGGALSELAWHEHLLACGACRNLLQAEEALEILLATLPEPKLPEHLARRVVLRLRDARRAESRLDALLELDHSARAPHDLGPSVLERLRPARERDLETALAAAEAELDRLLDQDRIIAVPNELAARVLAGLHAERGLAHAGSRASVAASSELARAELERAELERADWVQADLVQAGRTRWLRSPWSYAAAAAILATLMGWAAWQRSETGGRAGMNELARSDRTGLRSDGGSSHEEHRASEGKLAGAAGNGNAAPVREELAARTAGDPPERAMLAALDVLEQWDLLKSDDVDVFLSSAIGPADEALLEFQDADSATPPRNDKETEPRSKG